jgi:UDP-N-acetylmuramate-alanine ligase
LAGAIRDAGHKHVVYSPSMQEGIEYLLKEARPGDAIVSIGAGNVNRALGELAVLLGAKVAAE